MTAGAPPRLLEVPDPETVDCAACDVPPELEVLVTTLDVCDAEAPLEVVEAAVELGVLPVPAAPPAVMYTGIYAKSVPVYVSVVSPGKLASVPPKDSTQTAETVESSEQSMRAVLWR